MKEKNKSAKELPIVRSSKENPVKVQVVKWIFIRVGVSRMVYLPRGEGQDLKMRGGWRAEPVIQ